VNDRAELLQALQVQVALDYFNDRRFHECYEALERIWRVSGAPDRSLWQGIIQIAGACEKLTGGNWRGATSLFDTGLMLIEPYRPRHRGIDVDRLHRAGTACLDRLVKLGETRVGEFDLAALPRIEFERVRLEPKPR
jgi:predicted metal-dependent hydrolase